MKCFNHPALDATAVCAKCGKGLCIDCKWDLESKTYCQRCAKEIISAENSSAHSNINPNIRKEKNDTNISVYRKRGLSWSLVCFGAFIATVIGFALILPVAFLSSVIRGDNPDTNWTFLVIGILIVFLCAFVGGCLVGMYIKYRGTLHGLLMGLIFGVIVVIWCSLTMWVWRLIPNLLPILITGVFSPVFSGLGGYWGEQYGNR
jgi:hypothetical protein